MDCGMICCRKVVHKTVVRVKMEANVGKQKSEGPPSDFWSWRKYGQKPIKGSPYPRYHLFTPFLFCLKKLNPMQMLRVLSLSLSSSLFFGHDCSLMPQKHD